MSLQAKNAYSNLFFEYIDGTASIGGHTNITLGIMMRIKILFEIN